MKTFFLPTDDKKCTFSKKVRIETYGCQMNVADSEVVAAMMYTAGYDLTERDEEAAAILINTCSIRDNAEQKIFARLSYWNAMRRKTGRNIIIGVIGCMAERMKNELIERHGVDLVAGPDSYLDIPELVASAEAGGKAINIELSTTETYRDIVPRRIGAGVGGFISIMRGCNNFCSYCIVPYVRGREKSRPLEDIAEEARRYGEAGVKEITLLGQNVNSYGRDLYGEPRFADVLDAVDASGVERLRFATSHPKDLTDEVIARFGTLRSLMPALHLPVQSGSNRILAAMNRRYTREHYLGLIEKLRAVVPDIALSTDIIVGFPGETEEDFMETYRLVEEVGYGQVFTFIYSKREGTPAAAMEDDTPREVIQERFDRLVDLVQRKAWEANQGELDTIVPVLIEGVSKRDELVLAGKSPKNQTVHAPVPAGLRPEGLIGTIVPVAIDEARTWYLSGTVVDA